MKKILLVVSAVCIVAAGFSQTVRQGSKDYVRGVLTGGVDSYEGYFWFSTVLDGRGQRILYKTDLKAKKKKAFYADDFEVFTSDSLCLRSFKVVHYGTGMISAMIPRIVSGRLELYSVVYRGYYSFVKSDHYFMKDGSMDVRLTKKKFKEQLKPLLWGDDELVKRIENGEFAYDDIPEIISLYNSKRPMKKY